MSKLSTILISCLCGTFFACSSKIDLPDTQPPPLQPGETVIFEDNFSTLDFTVWNKETHEAGWVNQELQSYDYAHTAVGKDANRSVLMLTAEHKNGKIVSGRVNTRGKKNFRYGKLEASIKLPKTANGLWPAFWLMGDNNKQWPACGEIDIVEMGDAEGIKSGTTARRVNTAIHYGPTQVEHQQQYYASNAPVDLQDGNYHIYKMEWDENRIEISIDSIPFNTFLIKDNPYFHDNFYILFNLAVGGTFTGITDLSKITALKEGQKAVMYIDWIRIIDNK
jgi:beta-glucanase (GH16 family)